MISQVVLDSDYQPADYTEIQLRLPDGTVFSNNANILHLIIDKVGQLFKGAI